MEGLFIYCTVNLQLSFFKKNLQLCRPVAEDPVERDDVVLLLLREATALEVGVEVVDPPRQQLLPQQQPTPWRLMRSRRRGRPGGGVGGASFGSRVLCPAPLRGAETRPRGRAGARREP